MRDKRLPVNKNVYLLKVFFLKVVYELVLYANPG